MTEPRWVHKQAPARTAGPFIAKWQANTRNERATCQEHQDSSDLLTILFGYRTVAGCYHYLGSLKSGGGLSLRRQCGQRMGAMMAANRRAMMARRTAGRLGDG